MTENSPSTVVVLDAGPPIHLHDLGLLARFSPIDMLMCSANAETSLHISDDLISEVLASFAC